MKKHKKHKNWQIWPIEPKDVIDSFLDENKNSLFNIYEEVIKILEKEHNFEGHKNFIYKKHAVKHAKSLANKLNYPFGLLRIGNKKINGIRQGTFYIIFP